MHIIYPYGVFCQVFFKEKNDLTEKIVLFSGLAVLFKAIAAGVLFRAASYVDVGEGTIATVYVIATLMNVATDAAIDFFLIIHEKSPPLTEVCVK